MKREIIIAPSILSLDYSEVDKQLEALKESNAKWLHFDVMDGHFVPNLTFGPDILRGFKKRTSLFMDVHIMVREPAFISKLFIAQGADMITFHYEAMKSIEACIALCSEIQRQGCKCGISIKPDTPVDKLDLILKYVDLVLIMSVNPGFGGQAFIEESLNRIAYFNQKRKDNQYNYLIEVDGGINEETGKRCIDVGVDVLVAGSYVFKGDIKDKVKRLQCQR